MQSLPDRVVPPSRHMVLHEEAGRFCRTSFPPLLRQRICNAVRYVNAEECSCPLCVHLLSPSAFIRVPNSSPESATADKRRGETRMDADGFKEFPLHSSTASPMHLIPVAPLLRRYANWRLLGVVDGVIW
jgi:hypothetical protein